MRTAAKIVVLGMVGLTPMVFAEGRRGAATFRYGIEPFNMGSLSDIEVARSAAIRITDKALSLKRSESALKHLNYVYRQSLSLFRRKALAEMDFRDAKYQYDSGVLTVSEGQHQLADAEITSAETNCFRDAVLGAVGQELKLARLFVRHWENEIEWAKTLTSKSEVELEYRAYRHAMMERLAINRYASETDVSREAKDREQAKNGVDIYRTRIEVARANLKEAQDQLKIFNK